MEFKPIDEESRKQLPADANEGNASSYICCLLWSYSPPLRIAEIISVDALQRLHALANLAEVFQNVTDEERAELEKAEGRTLNDHLLTEEAQKLRELYARKAGSFISTQYCSPCILCALLLIVSTLQSWSS